MAQFRFLSLRRRRYRPRILLRLTRTHACDPGRLQGLGLLGFKKGLGLGCRV